MVCAKEVVVNGLGDTHHTALIAYLLHILGDFIAGIHGVVAAVIEEITDVVLLKDLQNALIVRVIHIRIRNLIPAGAKGRGGGILQKFQFGGVLLSHIKQTVIQYAFDAVLRSQHPGDIGIVQRSADHTICAGVDNGSGASGLAENTGAF